MDVRSGTHESALDGFVAGEWGARLGHVPIDFLGLQSASHPILETLARAFERGRESERILVNSWAAGLEAAAADAARRARDVRLSLIGPILGAVDSDANARVSADGQLVECLHWLDLQGPASVVYVAFGSEGFLAQHEVHEIASALDAAGRPFLWALRDGSAADSLPENLRPARLPLDKGLIVPWAPQRRVLAHRSVGAFLSHCGWNSVLESLWNGVPVVACPRLAEQNTNMWLVQRWGVGAAGVDTIVGGVGSMRSSGIVRALQQVLQQNESDTSACPLRQKAAEMSASARAAISPSGTSGQAFRELLHYITTSSSLP
jgi:UDP:flavonoid glycosyltransferase YjiC (YdhE family)